MIRKPITHAICLALLAFPLISGCGSGTDPGADLAISVKPDSEVLISPNSAATCADAAAYKKDPTTSLAHSATNPSLRFNTFLLEWTSKDILYIASIRYKVEGTGISGGKAEGSLSADEVTALLNLPDGVIPARPDTFRVSSTDTARLAATSGSAVCGFTIGGISLADGTKTKSFRARVTIEIIGSAQNSDGVLRFIKQNYTASASYYGS